MQCQLGVLAIYFKPNCYFYDISSYERNIKRLMVEGVEPSATSCISTALYFAYVTLDAFASRSHHHISPYLHQRNFYLHKNLHLH